MLIYAFVLLATFNVLVFVSAVSCHDIFGAPLEYQAVSDRDSFHSLWM